MVVFLSYYSRWWEANVLRYIDAEKIVILKDYWLTFQDEIKIKNFKLFKK
jgi:hypothetical protein